MEKDGMGFACVRTPKQDDAGLLNFAVRAGSAASPENRRQTDDAGGVSSAVAAVDVVRADHRAHKFLSHVVELIGGFRATEHAEGARPMLFDLCAESGRDAVQSLLPTRRAMLAVLADERGPQPVFPQVAHGGL